VVLHGIRAVAELGAQCLFIRGDSKLVINQVMKESAYCDMKMVAYYAEVQKLEDKFDGIELHHVLWRDNEDTDALARLASSRKPLLPRVFLDAPLIHLKGTKGMALADAILALPKPSGGTPPHQECVLVVTTHSRWGAELPMSALPDPPVRPTKHRR